VLLAAALLGAGGAQFLGFFEAVALGVDVDDLGAVDEAVDEGDDAGGVGEDLAQLVLDVVREPSVVLLLACATNVSRCRWTIS
jgi:hypothetical protein